MVCYVQLHDTYVFVIITSTCNSQFWIACFAFWIVKKTWQITNTEITEKVYIAATKACAQKYKFVNFKECILCSNLVRCDTKIIPPRTCWPTVIQTNTFIVTVTGSLSVFSRCRYRRVSVFAGLDHWTGLLDWSSTIAANYNNAHMEHCNCADSQVTASRKVFSR